MTSIPMDFIISNVINKDANPQQLINSWNNYNDIDKKILIDEIIIYQPIKCYTNYTVPTESYFKYITGGTNFLGGAKIVIGTGTSNYINESPKPTNNWHEFPTHILATDEIAFLPSASADVIFEEGTFLRAEIIDCSTGISGVSQKTTQNTDTFPLVLPIDYFEYTDSLSNVLINNNNQVLQSETDNGALQIIPNPASTQFFIDLNEEDWYDLQKIELLNPLGQVLVLPKEKIQSVSDLSDGMYFLKFYFSTGIIVVKQLIIHK